MIRLSASHPEWALGFEDEVWWSRLARPATGAWAEEEHPLRLKALSVPVGDPDPKAVACYGLYLRGFRTDGGDELWLRFVDGRPRLNRWKAMSQIPATSRESDAFSKDLKRRGFSFVGSTVMYAHMQAVGMVNDHLVGCFRYRQIQRIE